MEILELEIFSALLDVGVKLRDLPKMPIESDELHYYYENGCETLFAEIKALWSNSTHELHQSGVHFLEILSTIGMRKYIDKRSTTNHEQSIQDLLIANIDREMEKLTMLKSNFANTSSFFKSIIEKSAILITYLKQYRNSYMHSVIVNFHQDLKQKIEEAVGAIGDAQCTFKSKIRRMGELKVQAKQSERLVSKEVLMAFMLYKQSKYMDFFGTISGVPPTVELDMKDELDDTEILKIMLLMLSVLDSKKLQAIFD